MQLHRQPVSGDAHRLQKFFAKDFPRMHRPSRRAFISDAHDFFPLVQRSVVIGYFYVEGIALAPNEAHAVLIVDANAVLPGAVALQSLQFVAWRQPQIFQLFGCVEHGQLFLGGPPQISRRHCLTFACVPKFLRLFVREGLDRQG